MASQATAPRFISAGLLAALLLGLSACGTDHQSPPSPAAGVSAMQTKDLKPGGGAAVAPGQIAIVQYTGWLYDTTAKDNKGREFDSSRNSGQPFRFAVGTGSVIKGWDQGVVGMQVGGSRRLVIPPHLAYGDSGAGPIPAGATLVFDIDLIGIE